MKKILLSLCAFFMLSAIYAQGALWQKTTDKGLTQDRLLPRASTPLQYHLFTLNLSALKQQLQNAPLRGVVASTKVIVSFPDGNGRLKDFRIYEAPVMDAALSTKYPGIKSYVGKGVTNPSEIIRFSITNLGLHTMLSSPGETAYLDPYTKDLTTYVVYKKADLTTSRKHFCGVTDDMAHKPVAASALPNTTMGTDGTLRTYRLAMACTIEYADFHIQAANVQNGTMVEKKEAVLTAMAVTVTRVNEVYERDLSITMVLIANNDELIFIDEDNFDNSNTDNALLGQSQEVIDGIVGFDSYDIGHVVSTGGGGVAQLWSPCSGSKARGITGLWAPVGDAYDIDFVAHEMGHQFGGNHSFNNECGGNRNDDTAYEPGSGTTVMAYAGVCDPNVAPHSDAQFHINSINEMTQFITTAGDCGVHTLTGNIPPVANAGADYVIPRGTAFILSGSATDANNDEMTYCWEQMDVEISQQPPVASSAVGPNFRSLPPKEVPQRYMPDIESVLANNLTPTWEVIADVARSYTFAFTVRDNNPAGGQVTSDGMAVTVSGVAGPFVVVSPNTNVSWQAGTNQLVTWDAAGTTENDINARFVDILLSTDGGHTYPFTLGSKVPNDGSETITVPNLPGTANRIMVKGYNNIFYDLTNTNFTITAPSATMAIAPYGEQTIISCGGQPVGFVLNYATYGGFSSATTFEAQTNLGEDVITFSPASISATGVVNVIVSGTENAEPGLYPITILAYSGSVVSEVHLYVELLNADFGTVVLSSPADEATDVVETAPLTWQPADGATAYVVEVATDAVFTNIVASYTVAETTVTPQLAQATHYYWRVAPSNLACTGEYSAAFDFMTWLLSCNGSESNEELPISDAEEVTVTSVINVTAEEAIEMLTVGVKINHTWIGDVTVKLKSPQGTEVVLVSQQCEGEDNMNVIFDDNGVPLVCGQTPAISGTLLPQESLSAFNGESPEGNWTLTVSDNFGQDGGALVNWSVTFCNQQEVAGINPVAYGSALTLYPNPNNGNFRLSYTSQSANAIQLSVYDMRGRQVLSRSVQNTGLVQQEVSLQGAEAGIYLVTVQDGAAVTTQKIIIK